MRGQSPPSRRTVRAFGSGTVCYLVPSIPRDSRTGLSIWVGVLCILLLAWPVSAPTLLAQSSQEPRLPDPVAPVDGRLEERLELESEALQDPLPDATPIHPDEQLRQDVVSYFNSADPADWVRALTLLGARIDSGEAPAWSSPLLLDLLTDRAMEHPQRTRNILEDRLMKKSSTGIPVMLVLLRLEANWPFLDQVQNNFRSWAADPEQRVRLLTDFSAEKDPRLISRLLPILAAWDPRGTLDVAIDRLASDQEASPEALVDALSSFLGLQQGRAEWVRWWGENRHQPIFVGIIERKSAAALAEQLKTWERAHRLLREVESAPRFRNWILDSMRDSESIAIRRAALGEVPRFAQSIQATRVGDGSVKGPDLGGMSVKEILEPLRDRCLELVRALDHPSSLVSLPQSEELAIDSLVALSSMLPFSQDPELVRLLEERIHTLVPGLSNGKRRIAREALKMATALRSPVTDVVDDAIERFIPARGDAADVAELKRLIAASRAVGITIRTVEYLTVISNQVPELNQAVLEALVFGEIPEDAVAPVLTFYAKLLENSTDENLRSIAINGLGRLGVEEVIPMLTRLVLGGEIGSELERRSSLQMILSIGGVGACDGFIHILTKLPRSDDLFSGVIQQAVDLVPTDPSLGFLRRLMIDDSGQQRAWIDDLLDHQDVKAMLLAAAQPTDLRTRSPGRFEQWMILQKLVFERAIAQLVEEDSETGWSALLAEAAATIPLFGDDPLPENLSVIARQIRIVEVEIVNRRAVEAALVTADPTAITSSFSLYLDRIAGISGETPVAPRLLAKDPWEWLLLRLESRPPLESDPVLIRSMRLLAEGHFARDDVKERLDRLEARVDSGDQDRSPTPPLPVPPEEADGRE